MSEDEKLQVEAGKQIRLILDDDHQPSVYATNMTVQHTPHEFVISFYEAHPPVILGSPEEREAQLQAIDHVYAPCVARITVAASRMGSMIKALQENFESYQRLISGGERSDE
ncbi:MAG: DUF3467 domain-containing protein [Anaerolineae bacterium]